MKSNNPKHNFPSSTLNLHYNSTSYLSNFCKELMKKVVSNKIKIVDLYFNRWFEPFRKNIKLFFIESTLVYDLDNCKTLHIL